MNVVAVVELNVRSCLPNSLQSTVIAIAVCVLAVTPTALAQLELQSENGIKLDKELTQHGGTAAADRHASGDLATPPAAARKQCPLRSGNGLE